MVFEIFGPELGGMILLGLWLYAILDVISTDDMLVRNLSKGMWLLIVIFLPDVGSIAWLMVGRPHGAGWRPGDTTYRPAKTTEADLGRELTRQPVSVTTISSSMRAAEKPSLAGQ